MSGSHLEILEILMGTGRLDIIYNSFVDNADILMDYVRERGVQMSTDDYTYFISVRAGFFVGVIRAWITGGKCNITALVLTDRIPPFSESLPL